MDQLKENINSIDITLSDEILMKLRTFTYQTPIHVFNHDFK